MFADEKVNVTKILKSLLGSVETIVRKGENSGYQHFLLFPQCFQKISFLGSFTDKNLHVFQMKISLLSLNSRKTLKENEKILATSIFSFSHNVFQKAPVLGFDKNRDCVV